MTARPSTRTLLLGSRFTAPFIMAGCAFVAYQWWGGGGQGIIGLLAIGLFLASAKAVFTVAAYRRWRVDWEGMSPQAQVRKPGRRVLASLLALAAIPALLIYAGQPVAPAALHDSITPVTTASLTFAWLLIAGRLLWMVRPKAQARRKQPTPLVLVAIKRPLLPVPTIRDAYQRLPPYCQQLLRGQA